MRGRLWVILAVLATASAVFSIVLIVRGVPRNDVNMVLGGSVAAMVAFSLGIGASYAFTGATFPTLAVLAFLICLTSSFLLLIANGQREKMMPFAAAIKDSGIAGPLGAILMAIVVIPLIWNGLKQRMGK